MWSIPSIKKIKTFPRCAQTDTANSAVIYTGKYITWDHVTIIWYLWFSKHGLVKYRKWINNAIIRDINIKQKHHHDENGMQISVTTWELKHWLCWHFRNENSSKGLDHYQVNLEDKNDVHVYPSFTNGCTKHRGVSIRHIYIYITLLNKYAPLYIHVLCGI